MKKLTLLLASVFAIATQSMAHGYGYANINSYADAFVFDEMGVTFSVYPDGEFDFYLGDACRTSTISNGYVNVTFNSGYDYNPYVQYDDFGAVIQVENVPVWYDYYGRVSQIGDVMISYRNRRVCQVGGLYVHYNRHGHYAYHTGFINRWNPYFVYRPFYVAFARPVINLCFVRTTPYRQYYRPVRYTYYRPYVRNVRPCYATVGHTYRPRGYGQAHHRYTQTAGRGEVAFKRERRKITTASVMATSANRGRVTSNRGTTNSSYSRSTSSVKPSVNRSTTTRTINSSRNAKPTTTNRAASSSKPTQVRTAPSRTTTSRVVNKKPTTMRQSGSTVSRTAKPSGSSVSRGAARTSPTRSTVNTSRTARTQSSSRATASKPRTSSSSSRASSAPGRSSTATKSPSSSSSSKRSATKGSSSRNSLRKGGR